MNDSLSHFQSYNSMMIKYLVPVVKITSPNPVYSQYDIAMMSDAELMEMQYACK